MPGVVFINQAFKKSEKIMLVSYQAEKIQHLTVSGLLDFFWKDRIVDVQKIGTVSSGLMDFFSKDEIVDVQTLIRRTHHPAGRIGPWILCCSLPCPSPPHSSIPVHKVGLGHG